MCSTRGARALPRAGCPIQKPPDHRSLPTPRRLSQVAASFFGSWCLGIHLGPLLACSTYNHSSISEEIAHALRRDRSRAPKRSLTRAEELLISHVKLQKEDPEIALRHSGDLDRPIRLSMCWWR